MPGRCNHIPTGAEARSEAEGIAGARPGIQAMRTAEGLAPGLSLLTAGTAGRNPAEHAQTLTDAGRRFRAVTVQPRQFIANGAD